MKALLMIFVGGGLGSVCRYLVHKALQHFHFALPLGTFGVNIFGSLLLGFIMGWALKSGQLSNNILLFLASGFCGGFTTFSTFAYENQALLRSGEYLNLLIYSFGSILLGILAVMLGLYLSKIA